MRTWLEAIGSGLAVLGIFAVVMLFWIWVTLAVDKALQGLA